MLFFLLFSREEISPGRLSVVGPGVITSAADDSRPASASSPALSRLAFVRETGERGKRQSGPNYYFLWAQDVSSTSSQRIPPLWRYSGTCQRPDGKTLSTFPFSCWCSVGSYLSRFPPIQFLSLWPGEMEEEIALVANRLIGS